MKIKLENISLNYEVKKIDGNDISDVYNLCKKNTTYYKYMKMEPTYENLEEVITCLPPNKTMEDKFFVGFYKGNCLIAVLDLITKYPDNNTAFIGWFMMNKDYQGLGIGTKIVNEIFVFLKGLGFSYVRLGYIKGNKESELFWIKNKFKSIGIESKQEDYTVVILQRDL